MTEEDVPPVGMENIFGIRAGEDCTELFFDNGYAICSHMPIEESMSEHVPSLRLPEDKEPE